MSELVTIGTQADRLREALPPWQALPVSKRLAVIGRFRRLLARHATEVALTLGDRPLADTLTAEILPVLEAARFLERQAGTLLAPRRLGHRFRPLWLAGVDQVVIRAPFGAVLILAPSNYPIMLPGIQTLQALVAGNAVAWKPGRFGAACANAIASLLAQAGLPEGTLHVADEADATGERLIGQGFDRIVLTGSAVTGRAVLSRAAETLTPCTVELSGADPVFVLPGADFRLVADCLAYGMRLNGGHTCIAPRRVIGSPAAIAAVEAALTRRIADHPSAPVAPSAVHALRELVAGCAARGARLIGAMPGPDATRMTPLLLADSPHDMAILSRDIFAPWLALVRSDDLDQAITIERSARYALGASIFGPLDAATAIAGRLPAGAVTINDLIVPTADPRLGFGGAGDSGFGTTRGPEGLLEMTRLRTLSIRRTRGFRPHLRSPRPDDHTRMAGLIELLHATTGRARSLRRLLGRDGNPGHIEPI